MSYYSSCICICHNVTDGNTMGCDQCYQYHQGTITPQIYPQQPIIEYTPIMLEKLDKIIELLGKLLNK